MSGHTYLCDGVPLQLGRRLGGGGEGSVFALPDGRVAKLYSARPAPPLSKLNALIEVDGAPVRAAAAWPEQLVYSQSGALAGFVMPRVEGFAPIASAANPAARKRAFPQAGWAWLAHAGRNLALAVREIHAAGVVVGDLSESNVLVASDARVRLIDVDSFQIVSGGRLFGCDVGTPMYQPPELQGRSFVGLVRTANHDRFGLAVLVFQLLFMGRHPWAGLRAGKGELSFENGEYIATLPFAFGTDARRTGFLPPDDAVKMEWLSSSLQALFERAFAKGSPEARPSGEEWARELEAFESVLARCANVRTHDFPRSLERCPWCRFDRRGVMYFIVEALVATRELLDIAHIEAQLRAVVAPQEFAPPALPAAVAGEPVDRRLVRRVRAWYAEIGASGIASFAAAHWLAFAWAAALAVVLAVVVIATRPRLRVGWVARRQRLEAAQHRYAAAKSAHDALLRDNNVATRKRELLALLERYKELPSKYQSERQTLERDRYRLQLEEFLDRVLVRDAAPWRIGRKTRATLAAYGLETAKDVALRLPHTEVPGIGNRKRERLAAWVDERTRRFRFDPHRPIDPALLYAIARREQDERSTLERHLRGGPDALRRAADALLPGVDAVRTELDDAGRALAQAEADWSVLQWL